ncbi:MAG: ribulose-phosphate 3-epimerase [Chloroflexi bacterium]|nr:ribulose-phosphate 3-epimerase [Chloroflexota bacterium]
MNKFLIAPSIIASDFTTLGDEIVACESAGADWIHVDVMDGHFVPTITVGPLFVEACRRATKLPLDAHLMVSNPDQHLEVFAKAGANRLTVHVETCPNLIQTIERIKSLGCRAGVTLNPSTPASALDAVLPLVDLVLVMSVNPGYSGQKFMPEMIGKVEEIRGGLDAIHSQAFLQVDGGMSVETVPLMYNAGANVFVVGNFAFKHPMGVGEAIRLLRGCIPA